MISVENERNFENMLFADASALPPPQDTVTPWHTAMHYILWGLGLTTITLHFLNLDVILTAVGAALLVLACDWLFFYYMPGYSGAWNRFLWFVLPSAVLSIPVSLPIYWAARKISIEFKIDNGVV